MNSIINCDDYVHLGDLGVFQGKGVFSYASEPLGKVNNPIAGFFISSLWPV